MVIKLDPWKQLRAGDVEAGLAVAIDNFKKDYSASTIMELGVALLWARRYESAKDHFDAAIKSYNHSSESFFAMAGVARWCMNEPELAVEMWRQGLDAEYTGAGHVEAPLLLFFASNFVPRIVPTADVRAILENRVKRYRDSWPVPIASLMLGFISESDLRTKYFSKHGETEGEQEWILAFYRSFLQYDVNSIAFSDIMQQLCDESRPEWTDHDYFLTKMWTPEFFLARHLAGRNP